MTTAIEEFISTHASFTTDELEEMLRLETPGVPRSTMYYKLNKLCELGRVARTGKGRYVVKGKPSYRYELSSVAKGIASTINGTFPLIDYQIWELYQMNEFVNHLMARNTVFVEVERMLDESVFALLFDRYPHVLLNPSSDEYYKYVGDATIVVCRLVTEAPRAYGDYHQVSLEKLLVDLFGRGVGGAIVPRSEYPLIFEDAFDKYNVNQAKMFRYARRRGVDCAMREFIAKETDIVLVDVK